MKRNVFATVTLVIVMACLHFSYPAKAASAFDSNSVYYIEDILIKNNTKGEFNHNYIECINIDGTYYAVGLSYREHDCSWKSFCEQFAEINNSSVLPSNWNDLRNMIVEGLCSDKSGDVYPFFKIDDDFLILVDCISLISNNGTTVTNANEYTGFRVCKKIQPDRLYTEGWHNIGKNKYYIKNGSVVKESCAINGIRYKFSSDGVCQGKYTGWTKSANGKRYYKNGVMVTNKWLKTKSGQRYYAGADGYIHID